MKIKHYILVITATTICSVLFYWWQSAPRKPSGKLTRKYPAESQLRFFAVGDTGSGDRFQYSVAAAMEKRCLLKNADGIFLLGDNFIQSGVSSVNDLQWSNKAEKVYGSDCLGKLPIFAILGNHDYKGNPSAEIEKGLTWKRWVMPNRFYSLTFGNLAKFIEFDSNVPDFCFNAKFCALDFLLKNIRGTGTKWKFIMAHHPVSSASLKYEDTYSIYKRVMMPLICRSADFYISGHTHHLEHRVMPGCKTNFFIVGGGGSELMHIKPDQPETRFGLMEHGFLEFDITTEKATFRFFSDQGKLLYKTKIQSQK